VSIHEEGTAVVLSIAGHDGSTRETAFFPAITSSLTNRCPRLAG
jgi:hypothetical protein